jgi:hypothetical protein
MNIPHHRFPWGRHAAAAAAAVAACTTAGAHAVHIDLCAQAATPVTRVTLADIASIRDADDATAARLGALDVGQVSADGMPTVVDRATLSRWIQARTGLLSQDIAWGGAQRCNVRIADAATVRLAAPAEPAPDRATRAAPAGVTRGNVATLRSTNGAIRLESRVEVLQDGAVGQEVRVRLPGASEGVPARVVAPGQVEALQ